MLLSVKMGTVTIILFCISVLTQLRTCVAMGETDANGGDIYQQLLRRVENLEKRDQQQQAEIDTLRGELNTEKQRTAVLEGRLFRLQTALADRRGNGRTDPTFAGNAADIEVGTPVQETDHFDESAPIREHRPAKPSGHQSTGIRRHVDMPVIAFHATLQSHLVHTGVHQSIAFERVVTNIGAAYNPHVGSFVAPVAGVYVFETTLSVYNHNKTHASIVRNGVSVAGLFASGVETAWNCDTAMAVLHLNKGDDVMVQTIDTDQGINGNHYSMFSGFLLYNVSG